MDLKNQILNKIFSSLKSGLKDPLYKNSLFLIFTPIIGNGIGFCFWIVAAKLYTNEDIGIATTVMSSIGLILLVSKFGLDNSMIRFFRKDNIGNIFSTCLIINTLSALVFGMAFLLVTLITKSGSSLINLQNAFFFLSLIVLNSIASVTGNLFIALRKTEIPFLQNIVTISRIFLLFPLVLLGAIGILSAIGASFVLTIILTIYIFKKLNINFRLHLDHEFLKESFKFSISTYFSVIFLNAPSLILPIMIFELLGADEAAYYYIVFSLASLLFLIPGAVSTSLFVEGCHGASLIKTTLKSLCIIIALLVPNIIILYFSSDWILGIIGEDYIEGAGLLRLLALSSFFLAIVSVCLSINQIKKNNKSLFFNSFLLFILLLSSSSYFIKEYGLIGVGYAWILAYGISAVSAIVTVIMSSQGFSAKCGEFNIIKVH